MLPQNLTSLLTNPYLYVILGCLLSGIFGFLGFLISLKAIVDVKALHASTHSVQYMPIDPQIDKENQEFAESWATTPESISEQDKLFKEDLEEEMPAFVPEKDDKKKYSF